MAESIPLHTILFGDLPAAAAREFARLAASAPELRLIGPVRDGAELAARARELRAAVVVTTNAQMRFLTNLARPTRILLYGLGTNSLSDVEALVPVSGELEPLPHLLAERASWRLTLLQKIRLAAVGLVGAPWRLARPVAGQPPTGLVIIGASTGGPSAVEAVLAQLRPGLRCAIVVAVHLPAAFTASLVARLRRASVLPVVAASPGSRLVAGQILVVPGGTNMLIRRGTASQWAMHVAPDGNVAGSDVPSIDLLMSSAASAAERVLGVVLTGLGHDGTQGARVVREHGGQVLVQDAASAAVFSMPGAVLRAGLATAALPLNELAAAINTFGGAKKGAELPAVAPLYTSVYAV